VWQRCGNGVVAMLKLRVALLGDIGHLVVCRSLVLVSLQAKCLQGSFACLSFVSLARQCAIPTVVSQWVPLFVLVVFSLNTTDRTKYFIY